MKRVFINDDNLDISDLDYEVIRVKGIIINSKNEVLLAHNNNTYQFPGGHQENNEDMEEALTREIKEETGIDIYNFTGPFMQITTYAKNYFHSRKNVCNKIYYYRILSDEVPNLEETNYDELERQTDFNLIYVSMDDLNDFLKRNIDNGMVDVSIGKEMLLVLEEYHKLYGGVCY